MNQLLALLSATGLALGTQAQPTLTLTSNAPVAGTTYTQHYGPWIAAGGGGPNQTWDLSALIADSSHTVLWTAPGNTPNGPLFPTATMAEVSNAVIQYYRVASDGIHFAGSDDGTSAIVHAPQGTYLPFPCTIGTTWATPQNATFTFQGNTVVRTGTFSGQADGHGTLLMPGGSIPNVLRVHWIHEVEDDMNFFTISTTYDGFAYFVAGQAHPVAEMVTASIDFGGGTQTRQFSRWTSDISTGVAGEQKPSLGLYPNPASAEVTLNLPRSLGAASSVLIADMNGRTVLQRDLVAAEVGRATIDISSLFPGNYTITITGTNGQRSSALLCVQ